MRTGRPIDPTRPLKSRMIQVLVPHALHEHLKEQSIRENISLSSLACRILTIATRALAVAHKEQK